MEEWKKEQKETRDTKAKPEGAESVEPKVEHQEDEGMAENLLGKARACAPHFPEGVASTNIGDLLYGEDGLVT